MTEPQATTFEAVVKRLEKAEKQIRWAKFTGVVALLLVGAGVMMGQARSNGRTVEAEKFVLRDAGGRKRAELAVPEEGSASLTFFGDQEKARMDVGLSEDGVALLSLSDKGGTTRASLFVSEEGSATLGLGSAEGHILAILSVPENDLPYLRFSNRKGKARAWLKTTEAGVSYLALMDEHEKSGAGLSIDKDGSADLTLRDRTSRFAARLRLSPKEQPNLSFYGHDGKCRARMGVGLDVPYVQLYDAEEHCRARFTLSLEGYPNLELLDAEQANRIDMMVFDKEGPRMDFLTPKSRVGVTSQGLTVYDGGGVVRTDVGFLDAVTPGLVVRDKEGMPVFEAP